MTAARAVVGGVTESWSRRTIFRKAVLAPWDPRVEHIFLYALAEAAHKYGVTLHTTTLVPDHHHTTGTVSEANADLFLGRVHHPVSCALNALLGQRGYDPMAQIWNSAQPSRVQLVGPAAMMAQLVYDKVQNVAAGLVRRPEDWPGFSFSWDLWRPGRIVRVMLPDLYYDRRYHAPYYDVDFRAPWMLLLYFGGDLERLIYVMKKLEREVLAYIRRARKGRRFRGPKAVLQIHPYDEPRTPREERGQTIPTFKLGPGGGEERKSLRIRCCQEVTAFRQQSRDAFARHKAGEADVVFPYGTGKMARLHNVQVEPEPHPDAILYTPDHWAGDIGAGHIGAGDTASDTRAVDIVTGNGVGGDRVTGDVAADIGADPHTPGSTDQLRQALQEVRTSMKNHFAELLGDPSASKRRDASAVTTVGANDAAGDAPQATDRVAIQTLRGRRRTDPAHPPRRIVVLRTRNEHGRRANDPPGE